MGWGVCALLECGGCAYECGRDAGDMKKIFCHGKNGKGKFSLVDDEDYDYLNQWKWYSDNKGYIRRREYIKGSGRKNKKQRSFSIHGVLMKPPKGMIVDHENHKVYDNQKKNLRIVTNSQNQANRIPTKNTKSKYKGVVWFKTQKLWCARIRVNYKQITLAYFKKEKDAAKAYNEAAIKYFGKYAMVNKI